jgi:outer membrane protein TolC
VAPAPAKPLSLTECIGIALDRQPALAAARASLAVSQGSLADLERHRLAALLSREVPVRKKQAELGVVIAQAGLNQAEWETIYAVTRLFYSVLYAQAQKELADTAIQRLTATRQAAQFRLDQQKGGGGENQGDKGERVTPDSIKQIGTYLLLAETRREEAVRGKDRALAALREAMGVEPCFPLKELSGTFPDRLRFNLCRSQVIDLAVSRRGEMAQAANGAAVAALEIDAQATSCLFSMRTFASLADVHAKPIPQGEWNGNYRPGALGIEMPPTLAGTKHDRVRRAQDLSARMAAVVDKTRNLITLEAENMFYQWQAAAAQIGKARQADRQAAELVESTSKDFIEKTVGVKAQLDAIVLFIQARLTYNETRYKYALTLAGLQRVTAGGFAPGLDGTVVPAPKGGRKR